MSSFGGGYGSGSNSFSPIVNAKLTIAMPTTQRQRRDRSRPSGKTNATASGQANSWRHGCPLGLVRPRRTDELLRGDLESRQERSEQEDPRDAVARELEGDQEADDGWGQDRECEERIDRERDPVLLVGGKTSSTCSSPTVSAASVASATPQARIRRPRIICSGINPHHDCRPRPLADQQYGPVPRFEPQLAALAAERGGDGRSPATSSASRSRARRRAPKRPFVQRWSWPCCIGKLSPLPVFTAMPGSRNGFFGARDRPGARHQRRAGRVRAQPLEAATPSRRRRPCRTRGRRRSTFAPFAYFPEQRAVQLHPRVVLPPRVGRVLEDGRRDRPLDELVLPALGGEHHDVRGAGDRVVDHERLPREPVREDVGLDRERRRREDRRDVRARGLQLRDLRAHVGEVTSYGSAATTLEPERPSPRFRLARRSLP